MNKICNKEYSLFSDISQITSAKEKKEYVGLVKDFINLLSQIYKGDTQIDNINDDYAQQFLIKAGIIKRAEDIKLLKLHLGKEYNRLIALITINRLDLETNIDENIKKFMDCYRLEKIKQDLLDSSKPTVVDFFCGAGGLSLGFKQNGFKILLANDIEEVCTKTYFLNHPEMKKSQIIHGDIKNVVENIENYVAGEVDVILGGPPCQGFSMANRQRIINDPRNVLYKYYVKAVESLKPKFFVMENVKGMLSVAEQVKEDFHSLQDVDYEVAYHVFNAKDFSVPQNRERLIYIGIRKDICAKIEKLPIDIINEIIEYNKKTESYNLMEAIGDLRPLEPLTIKNATELDTEHSGYKIEKVYSNDISAYVEKINQGKVSTIIYNHKARYNNDRDIEIFSRMLPGDKSDSERIADIMPYTSRSDIFKDKYFKLKPESICKTITAHMKFDCNMYIHPYQARGLTPREAARVQSYPDDYYFLGAYTKTYMQVGNSVPPLMSRNISRIIKKYL